MLAYNLVRGVMAEAARRHGLVPRKLSLQGARQTMEAFRGAMSRATAGAANILIDVALRAIASHHVGDRPDRVEPRVRKRRPKAYPLTHEPRCETKKRLLQVA